jgi:hypothetical protein
MTPVTFEYVARLIEILRAHGARVVNAQGQDFRQEDIEDLLKEFPQ